MSEDKIDTPAIDEKTQANLEKQIEEVNKLGLQEKKLLTDGYTPQQLEEVRIQREERARRNAPYEETYGSLLNSLSQWLDGMVSAEQNVAQVVSIFGAMTAPVQERLTSEEIQTLFGKKAKKLAELKPEELESFETEAHKLREKGDERKFKLLTVKGRRELTEEEKAEDAEKPENERRKTVEDIVVIRDIEPLHTNMDPTLMNSGFEVMSYLDSAVASLRGLIAVLQDREISGVRWQHNSAVHIMFALLKTFPLLMKATAAFVGACENPTLKKNLTSHRFGTSHWVYVPAEVAKKINSTCIGLNAQLRVLANPNF